MSLNNFAIFLLLTFAHPTLTQLLTVEYSSVKLPSPNSCPSPYYDGADLIYLFGRCETAPYTQILTYSISSETISQVGTMPFPGMRGSVQADNFGNLYFIGGHDYRKVFKFDPVTGNSVVAAILPFNMVDHVSLKYNATSNTVFLFGAQGEPTALLAFDVGLLNYTDLATLPHSLNAGTAVCVGNKAYGFGSPGLNNTAALELDLDTYRMMAIGPSSLPMLTLNPTSVFDGSSIYLVGGYLPNVGLPMARTGGMFKFDPVTFENEFTHVRNFPVEGLSYYRFSPAAVFLPDLNRIYFFGGSSFNFAQNVTIAHDDIYYIDLSPINWTTTAPSTTMDPNYFSCVNRTNGLYPHPTDCALYLGCQNDELFHFSCSPPQLFDPIMKRCDFPDLVECQTSCLDRPDGFYLHPHDCSLYVMCRSGQADVLRCPDPLLFHPVRLNCAFPDEVECLDTV